MTEDCINLMKRSAGLSCSLIRHITALQQSCVTTSALITLLTRTESAHIPIVVIKFSFLNFLTLFQPERSSSTQLFNVTNTFLTKWFELETFAFLF